MRIPRISNYRNTKVYKWLVSFCNKNWVAKTIVISIVWFFALIPAWLYFIVRYLVDPVGFWQELALLVVSAIAIGWLQGIFIFIGVGATLVVLTDDPYYRW